MEIKDVAGFSQPLTKLLEVIEKGVGKLYEPTHLRRMALAKADEIKVLKQATTDAQVSKARQLSSLSEDTLMLLPDVSPEVIERAKLRLARQEIGRQQNIDRIVFEAAAAMPTDVDSREVDRGWIAKFFSAAADISDSDMQKLWGRLLAGETATPGRFNARALEVLKNLSTSEAELFSNACSFVTGLNEYIIKIPTVEKNRFISTYDDKALADLGLQFNDLLKLVDAGLIHPETGLSLEYERGGKAVELVNNGRYFTLTLDSSRAEAEAKIRVHVYQFTSAGKDLGTLVPNNFNATYFAVLTERFAGHGIRLDLLH